MSAAATTNGQASRMNAQVSPTVLARRPAPANPIAVEPNEAIERNALAGRSSSSLASSGIRLVGRIEELLHAGVQQQQDVEADERVDARHEGDPGDDDTAWTRQVTIMIRWRSWRST